MQDGALVTAPVSVAEDTAGLGEHDLVVLAVKGPSLAQVAEKMPPLLGPNTIVLTAMNGVPWWFFLGAGGAGGAGGAASYGEGQTGDLSVSEWRAVAA